MCDQLVAVLNLCDIFSNIFLGYTNWSPYPWGMISTSSPLGAMSFLVYFVCPVCLVYLVHLVSVVQPKNQTNRDETRPTATRYYKEGAAAPGLAEPGLPWR